MRRSYLLLVALLTALLWQSFVTQTHVHRGPLDGVVAATAQRHGGATLARSGAPSDQPANCPICRELAQAGHYLSPAAVIGVQGVVAARYWCLLAPLFVQVHQRWMHGWRSRAPPFAGRTP